MLRLSRPRLLLVIGLVAIAGTLAIVSILNREAPQSPQEPWLDEDRLQEAMKQLRSEKERCEELILTAIKRNRPHYEAMVRAVEKQGLKAGDRRRFAFLKTKSPDELRKVEASFNRMELMKFCEENPVIDAERLADGTLVIDVVVCEMGHAGTYSVFYTGRVMTQKEVETVKSAPLALTQIDPQWWAIVTWY